jgi:hypothetical protein
MAGAHIVRKPQVCAIGCCRRPIEMVTLSICNSFRNVVVPVKIT